MIFMDPKMLKELNQQIQEETYSGYINLARLPELNHFLVHHR